VLTEVGQRNLVIRDVLGASVSLRRLGQEATAVYRASGQRWVRLDPKIPIEAGTEACVETALEGRNLLALRVFLGATCGPTA
jgi:hypothetical protein